MSVIDQIAQALATAQVARPGRRQVLTGGAVALTAAVTLRTPDSEAKKKRHRKKKRKHDKGGGPSQGQGCGNGCVSSTCGQTPTDCPILPADNIWNRRVDALPLAAMSAAYVSSIGTDGGLHPDFGSGLYKGEPFGIPFVRVPAGQAKVGVRFTDAADESDAGPYPIPADAPVENGSCSNGDRHVIVVQEEFCMLYELFAAKQENDGSWQAFCGAAFDLQSNTLRTAGWTSADAAGLPILPGLVRYEEIASGNIEHALRFTAARTQSAYVWPARHQAGSTNDVNVPPIGQRFRLKAGVDISRFSQTNQLILQALKTYGMILADNGSNWFLSGAPDNRWDNDDLRTLQAEIHGNDFEAVDCSSLKMSDHSGQAAA